MADLHRSITIDYVVPERLAGTFTDERDWDDLLFDAAVEAAHDQGLLIEGTSSGTAGEAPDNTEGRPAKDRSTTMEGTGK